MDILGGSRDKNKKAATPEQAMPSITTQAVELGTIDYINLTPDGKHGDYNSAVQTSLETGRPIFANFVEWSGWAGCKEAGAIFTDPVIKRAAEELFVPCAFDTWDRENPLRAQPFEQWGAGLAKSWWGYLRIVDVSSTSTNITRTHISGGKQQQHQQQEVKNTRSLVVTGTKQITGRHQLEEVKRIMIEALEDLGRDVPAYLI